MIEAALALGGAAMLFLGLALFMDGGNWLALLIAAVYWAAFFDVCRLHRMGVR